MDLSRPFISRRLADLIQGIAPEDRESFVADAGRAKSLEEFETVYLPRFKRAKT